MKLTEYQKKERKVRNILSRKLSKQDLVKIADLIGVDLQYYEKNGFLSKKLLLDFAMGRIKL